MRKFLSYTLVIGLVFGCGGGKKKSADGSSSNPPADSSIFPITLSSDSTHFVDSTGTPFLLVGEAAWSLPVQLTKAQVITYLNDRKTRGFNTILFSMMEYYYSSQTPPWLNQDGNAPFTDKDDFTTANEAYFAHVDYIVEQALERDMLLMIAPAYLGWDCWEGDSNPNAEGWCGEMRTQGTTLLTQYGEWLGNRYKNYPNIVWVHGGDYGAYNTAGDLANVNAVANGIISAENSSDRMHTAHWGPGYNSIEHIEPWLSFDGIYSYSGKASYVSMGGSLQNRGSRPTIFFEGTYENEGSSAPDRLRAQMFIQYAWAGTGFIFGNSPIWKFDTGWEAALNSAGTQEATLAQEIMKRFDWHTLRGDRTNAFMTAGYGSWFDDEYVVASKSTDNSLAIAYYTDNSLNPTFDVSQLSGSFVARWIDPTTGTEALEPGGPFSNTGTRQFTPSGLNAGGDADWILVLEVE